MTVPRTASPRSAYAGHSRPGLSFELIESKLHPPWLRPGIVARTALVERLLAVSAGAVVCVVAPPGYGKTTLLAQWAQRKGDRTRRLLKSGAMTRGTVVGAEEDTSRDHDGTGSTTTYNPVVQFSTADGRTVQFTSAVGYSSEPDVGGAVDVRYLPGDPEQAEIDRAAMWVLPAAFGVLGGLALLVAGGAVYSEPQVVPAVVDTVDGPETVGGIETLEPVPPVGGPETSEPAPELRPPPPKVATGRIGDKLTVYDEFGNAQLEVAVTRLKFSRGGEFDQPQHGLYMGAYVKARALADGQELVDFYALVGGHHYVGDAYQGATAFDPSFFYVTLDTGERTAGWVMFDVPARHGQLVGRDLGGRKVGVWKY